MRRTATLVLGGTLAAGLAFAYLRGRPYRVPERPASQPAGQSAPGAAPPPALPASAPLATTSSPEPASSGGLLVPDLPSDAPRTVSFGVIVLTYRGAEGAPPDARSKGEALARAKELLPEAQQDFDAAVKKGDHGSTADLGSMPRGVLEPSLEYPLFTLKKGQVYGEPLDSPRGYWLVRRRP